VAEQLAPFRSIGVADSLGEIAASFPVTPIEAIEGGPVTAGMFEDKNGRLAVLLVNRDYRYGINARLRLRDGTDLPQLFDPIAGAWTRTSEAVFPIPPGAGRLLRWEQYRR